MRKGHRKTITLIDITQGTVNSMFSCLCPIQYQHTTFQQCQSCFTFRDIGCSDIGSCLEEESPESSNVQCFSSAAFMKTQRIYISGQNEGKNKDKCQCQVHVEIKAHTDVHVVVQVSVSVFFCVFVCFSVFLQMHYLYVQV